MPEPVHQREVAARPERATPFTSDIKLQAALLAGTQDGKFNKDPVAPNTVEDKLAKTPGERWSFGDVDKASMNERKAGVPKENWSPIFHEKIGKMNLKQQQQLKEAMGVLGCVAADGSLQDSKMLDTFSFAGEPPNQKSDTKAFLEKIITLPDVNKKMKTVKFLAGSLFGSATAGKMVAQMVDLEGRIKAAADLKTPEERQAARNALVQELVESSKTIKGSDAEKTIDSANALLGASGAEQAKVAEKGVKGGNPQGALENLAGSKAEVVTSGEVRVLSGGVGHAEQQIPEDPHSKGGDYYLTYKDAGQVTPDQLSKLGQLYVVMDTASIGGGSTATKQFAEAFMRAYYDGDTATEPNTKAAMAYQSAVSEVGSIHSTFTYAVKKGNEVWSGGVGNSPGVLVHKADNKAEWIYDPRGQSSKKLIDKATRQEYDWTVPEDLPPNVRAEMNNKDKYDRTAPTVLIANGGSLKHFHGTMQPGDYFALHTDGLETEDYSEAGLQRKIQELAAVPTGSKDDSLLLLIN